MPGARLHDVDDDEADDERERAHDFEVEQRERAGLADLLHVLHAGDAEHDGAEDDRGDQHLDELDEAVAQRLHRLARLGHEVTEQDARRDRDEHLHVKRLVERDAEPLDALCSRPAIEGVFQSAYFTTCATASAK